MFTIFRKAYMMSISDAAVGPTLRERHPRREAGAQSLGPLRGSRAAEQEGMCAATTYIFFGPPRSHRRMDRELDPVTSIPKRWRQLGANLSTFAGLLAFRTVRRS